MKHKRIRISLLLMVFLICLSSCGVKTSVNSGPQKYTDSYWDAFDTMISLTAYCDSREEFDEINAQAKELFAYYHRLFDIYKDYEGVNNAKTVNDNAGKEPVKVDTALIDLCYTCRRDFATALSIALHGHKHEMVYQQYNMGHKIDDPRFKRNDLTDEYYLHETKELLERSHRVNSFKIGSPTLA